MFETAELGRKVSKKAFKERAPRLRESLLMAQARLREADFPVLLLIGGVDGAGKSESQNLLNEWLDPRWLVNRAFGDPTPEERERPDYWRFWRALPARGQIGIFVSAWYSRPLLRRVHTGNAAEFSRALDEIHAFESTLTDDGAVIVKLWLHLGKQAQERRFKALESDPLQSWRVTEKDWKHWSLYDEFIVATEELIRRTSTGDAPWHIIDGSDSRHQSLRVGELLLDAIEGRLERESKPPRNGKPKRKRAAGADTLTVLDRLDMSPRLSKKDYSVQLEKYQGQINLLQREARDRKLSTLLVFEGPDAAGKGGAIRRLAGALDARDVRVHPIAAPTDEERAHHYLWRFWRLLPPAGGVAIFDRSWYGRVLVERVFDLAAEDEWRRAYAEINLFEQQLTEDGIALVKFWIHITKDEQKRRFKERQEIPYKRWKITEEDQRNRARWKDFDAAVHDMIERTSTAAAPWHLIPGNDKRFARIEVLRRVCSRLEEAVAAQARPFSVATAAGERG
jgi:polyphosphate:AMP phosphotransferase